LLCRASTNLMQYDRTHSTHSSCVVIKQVGPCTHQTLTVDK